MRQPSQLSEGPASEAPVVRRPVLSGALAGRGPATPAQALALQRMVGNRAAARILARWTKHPDPDQTGVMVPDVVAEDLQRVNPPQNK